MIAHDNPIPVAWLIGENNGQEIYIRRTASGEYRISHDAFLREEYPSLRSASLAYLLYVENNKPQGLGNHDLCNVAEDWVQELDASNGNYYPLLHHGEDNHAVPPCREVFSELIRRVREIEE